MEKYNINANYKLIGKLFYVLIFLIYLISVVIIFSHGFENIFQLIRRITGLTGIISLFIAILLSLLVKQSKQVFGISYLRIHHYFSISGIILVSIHPLVMAIDFGTFRIFIPDFSSWDSFLRNGGRTALYMIYIAAIAAIARKNIVRNWKYLHGLIYPAFIFGAIHGILQGSDLQNPILYALFIVFIVLVIFIFMYKRYLSIRK